MIKTTAANQYTSQGYSTWPHYYNHITIFTIFRYNSYIITENRSKTSIYIYFINPHNILHLIYIIKQHISYYKH